MRIQRALALLGVGSRRACDELVLAGRVTVNGVTAEAGAAYNEGDAVTVDGIPVASKAASPASVKHVYFAHYKEYGVVCTARDPQRRPNVVDAAIQGLPLAVRLKLLGPQGTGQATGAAAPSNGTAPAQAPGESVQEPCTAPITPASPRIFPVGRLDAPTEGLILLTSDGEFANKVIHPSVGVDKVYAVTIAQYGYPHLDPRNCGINPRDEQAIIERLRAGMLLEDGPAKPVSVRRITDGIPASGEHDNDIPRYRSSRGYCRLELVMHEGRKRIVRRMIDAVRVGVVDLKRTRIGPVGLASSREARTRLLPGQTRVLTVQERELLLFLDTTAKGAKARARRAKSGAEDEDEEWME